MKDFLDRVVLTWASQGLGIVMGEWGVTDHYKGSLVDIQHQNMAYYGKFLTTEARKRGISTFIWDNNQFGCGPEKFGIFDRERGMKVKNPWVLMGIFGRKN